MADDVQIPKGPLGTLQDELKALLKSKPFFSDILVLTENSKEMENEIAVQLGTLTPEGGSIGVFVIIATPKCKVTRPNVPGPVFDDVTVLVRVIENPTINQGAGGSKKRAEIIAREAAMALHHARNPNLYDPLQCLEMAPSVDDGMPDCVIYNVNFKTSLKQ